MNKTFFRFRSAFRGN